VRAPAQLQQAQAQLQQAQAKEFNSARDYRMQVSADRRATSAADINQATAQLRVAGAADDRSGAADRAAKTGAVATRACRTFV